MTSGAIWLCWIASNTSATALLLLLDGRSQWRTGTTETEVRLDGWCEGGLRQQRNDGGGCATMRERLKRVESPGTYVTEWVLRGHFCLALYSFGPPSHALVVITWRGGEPLHDAVGINCEKGATTENQGSGVKYGGWGGTVILMTECVCYLTWHDYPSLVEGESYAIFYSFINIVFGSGSDRPSGLLSFVPASLLSLISFLLFPCVSVWETLVHEFPMFYRHTEWYLPFFARRNSPCFGRSFAYQNRIILLTISL